MGLIRWIKKKFLGFDLESPEDVDKLASQYLKLNMQAHADTLRTAQKLNKAQMMEMQRRQLKQQIRENLDEDDDFDDEEDDDFESSITKEVVGNITKAISSKISGSQPSAAGLLPQNATPSQIREYAQGRLDRFSDEELEKMAKKGLI